MALLKKITDALKEPGLKVLATTLKVLFIDNPYALYLLTYGARYIPGVAPGHDHAENGAELIKGTLATWNYGPYLRENTLGSGGLAGLPLLQNSGYAATPKLLAVAIVTLPGGLSRLRGAFYVATFAGAGSVTLSPVLRGINWHNFKLTTNNLGVYATTDLVVNANGSNLYLVEFAFEAADLLKVKIAGEDARVELALYQSTTNLGATAVWVLGGEVWVDDDPTPARRGPLSSDPPLSEVTVGDILTGKLLLTTLARKLRGRLNAGIHAVLGRAPALGLDAVVLDRFYRWARSVKTAHSHRGVLVPDPRGGYIADGRCLRYPKVSAVYARLWGENTAAVKAADLYQVQGLKIHSGGALDATWASWDYDIDLEAGLGGLDLSVVLEPGNSTDDSRLLIHVGIFSTPTEGANLVAGLSCDYHRQESTDAGGLLVCEVEPEQNDAWQPNANRRLVGKSVYSQLAKKTAATATTLVETTNAYRVSKIISVAISHPAYTVGGVARPTGRYTLRVRYSLPSGGSYDANARVLAFEAIASKGY